MTNEVEIDEFQDDEIERHLVNKISHAIAHRTEATNLVARYFSFDSEFQELKDILEKKTNEKVRGDWSSVRRENLYYLNNLITEWKIIKKHKTFNTVEDRKACLNIKKNLMAMRKEITGEESSSRGDTGDRSVSQHQNPNLPTFERNKKEVHRWSSRHKPKKVHGLDHKVMAMERELVMRNLEAPFKVFGVVGVAGIGKTTLCQTIFDKESVKKHFSPRIWVCLSKQPPREGAAETYGPKQPDDPKQPNDENQRKEIVVRILECLGIEDEVISEAGNGSDGLRRLILLLRLQLIGKRYLIVLDDAWNHNEFFLNLTEKKELEDDWGEELAYALPKGCGGSVISSSRSDALLRKMLGKDVSLQYLKPYVGKENEIIYKIFEDTVCGYEEGATLGQYLQDLKPVILARSDGLPLGAKSLAEDARRKNPDSVNKEKQQSGGENKPPPASGAEEMKA